MIPTVKCGRGSTRESSSNTALTIAGVNSLEPRPYRPPITTGASRRDLSGASARRSCNAATMSRYSGSPALPGSLVRSSTAMARAEAGTAAAKSVTENGRKRRTFTRPTRSPRAASHSTVSCAVSVPEPIATMTRSAAGWPT